MSNGFTVYGPFAELEIVDFFEPELYRPVPSTSRVKSTARPPAPGNILPSKQRPITYNRNNRIMEFFLNVFLVNSLNSVTKKLLLQQKDSNPSHLLCERPTCYHSASTTHVRDRILKAQFMLQWFIWFPEFAEFSEHFPYLGKTPVFQ